MLLTSDAFRFPPFVIGSSRVVEALVKCLVVDRQDGKGKEKEQTFGVGVCF